MLSEAHYKAVLGFYFFLIADEVAALSLAVRAVAKTRREGKDLSPEQLECLLIQNMESLGKKFLAREPKPQSHATTAWIIPQPALLTAWRDYLRARDLDDTIAIVLHYILKFEVTQISKALGTPTGTIYYRLGKGLEGLTHAPSFKLAVRA